MTEFTEGPLSEQQLRMQRESGQQAKEILQGSLWTNAVAQIEANLLIKMGEHHSDPVQCQEIALTKVILDQFVGYFEEIAEAGDMAAEELQRIDK